MNRAENVPIIPINNVYSITDLKIKEGTILNKKYTVNLSDTTQRFLIPNANVDTSTVSIQVQNSASDTGVATWADGNSLDVTTISSTQKVFFLQEIEGCR